MASRLDESILDSMLEDPNMRELYGDLPDKEAIRKLLTERGSFLDREIEDFQTASPGPDAEQNGARFGNVLVEIDDEEMAARISLLEPEDGKPHVTAAGLKNILTQCGIVAGINETYLGRLASTPIYNRSFVIAKGQPAAPGTEDKIKYYFDCDKSLKPKEDAGGRIDYMELAYSQTVSKDDLLCELIPGVPGADGFSITGRVLKSSDGKNCKIPSGQNTYLSDDHKQLFASCDGEISMRDGKVVVDKVLRVQNVDASTGNLRFIGSIFVEGKICEGFTVKATGNLTVGEVIEGADVSADGDIQVAYGIKGAGKGMIRAGGSLRTFFIENMSVSVKKDIFADVIMSSQVDCGGKVCVAGKRGRVLGGKLSALELEAVDLGNDSHIKTEVMIRGMDALEAECGQIDGQLKLLQVAEKNLQALVRDTKNTNRVGSQKELLTVIYQRNRLTARKQELTEEIARAKAEYSFDITVRGAVYPNVALRIGPFSYFNKTVQESCIFLHKENHIIVRRRNY